jgi:hypothetical protein
VEFRPVDTRTIAEIERSIARGGYGDLIITSGSGTAVRPLTCLLQQDGRSSRHGPLTEHRNAEAGAAPKDVSILEQI